MFKPDQEFWQWLSGRFKLPASEAPETPKVEIPPDTVITLYTTDTLYERAHKIWKLLGFSDDRQGMVLRLTGLLGTYQDVDHKAIQPLLPGFSFQDQKSHTTLYNQIKILQEENQDLKQQLDALKKAYKMKAGGRD